MTIELPSWVPEFEEEYAKFNKKDIFPKIGLTLVVISYIFVFSFGETIKNNYILGIFIGITISVGAFLVGAYSNRKLPSASKYMGSIVYSIGFHLERNSDPESNIYISKMDNFLKNWDAIIRNVNYSLRRATYVNNTRDYLKKSKEIIELLNEYYINYPRYHIDKSNISKKLIQLGDIMHTDNGYVTLKHLDLMNSLVDDLRTDNVKEKPLSIPNIKRMTLALKTRLGGLPDWFKLMIYIIIVFLIVYELISYLAVIKNIPQDTAFGYAIGGGIASLVPALMIKDYIIK